MPGRKGFTLIELLVSVSIFAVLMVSLYSAFSSGLFGYRGIQDKIDTYLAVSQFFNTLDKDLRNSFSYSESETKFSGQPQGLSFLTLADNYRSGSSMQDYAFVSYFLEGGLLKRLIKTNQDSLNSDSDAAAEELGVKVNSLAFSYLYEEDRELKEKDSWAELNGFPVAVRVKLVVDNKGNEEFKRAIYLHE